MGGFIVYQYKARKIPEQGSKPGLTLVCFFARDERFMGRKVICLLRKSKFGEEIY